MADQLIACGRHSLIRKAALAAVASLGVVAAAPVARGIDARLVDPAGGHRILLDINNDRLADAQRRVDEAQSRVDQANDDLQRVRGPALREMEDSPEFQRATRNA